MADFFVMCPECGLRGVLTDGQREFRDPDRQCKHRREPANCPSLRGTLSAAQRMFAYVKKEPKQ
jgi:hypothetical protein